MRALIFLISVQFLFSACNPFAPKLVDDESIISGFTITEQSSPRDVLVNFRYAYVFKDSLIYSDLLDSSFIFISTNYGTNPPSDILWGKDKDVRTTVGLFRHFNSLDLTWGEDFLNDSTLYNYTDSLNSSVIITYQLTIDGGQDIPTLKGEVFFNFKKQNSGRWRITRWEDLASF
jgi:hypothetical protein